MTTSAQTREIERRVRRALDLIDRGEAVDVGRLCEDRPELESAVGAALARVADLPDVYRAARGHDPVIGERVMGRYLVEERIGAGAMGVVYRAQDEQLGRAVAVKLLRFDGLESPAANHRFAREAEALARVRHPAVVTILDRGQDDAGRAFLVMELLQGRTAAAVLAEARSATDVREAVRWVASAAEGLIAAHAAGVVHRDIKPSNLFLRADGGAVLLDFGIVALESDVTALTVTGAALGTPAYMAPEQLRAAGGALPTTDVYGLAATLYHLVTGRAPYVGEPQQVLAALARSEPEPADRVRPGLPADLVAILEKGMARRPSDRYASAAALRDDLFAWLDYRPVSARRLTPIGRLWRWARRSRTVRASVVTALVVIAALALWQAMSSYAEWRDDEFVERFARVPPALLVAPAGYRATSAVTASDEVARLLDELVEGASSPCPALALRALLHVDRGALPRAAEDLERIATGAEAPVARWLASECRAGRVPDPAADPGAVPEAGGADDHYVAALFALRSARPDGARAARLLRAVPDRAERVGFDELLITAEMLGYDAERHGSVEEHYDRLLERCRTLTTARGRPVAALLQVEANALLVQRRIGRARAAVARALALADEDFVLQIAAGAVAFRQGDYAAAVPELRRAVELQPRSVQAHELLALSELYSGDVPAAQQTLAITPFEADRDPEARRASLAGKVLFERAFLALEHDAQAASGRDLARQALDAFDRAEAAGAKTAFEHLACAALLDDSPAIVAQLVLYLEQKPLDPYRLERVAPLLGATLDADATQVLKRVLLRQSAELLRDG